GGEESARDGAGTAGPDVVQASLTVRVVADVLPRIIRRADLVPAAPPSVIAIALKQRARPICQVGRAHQTVGQVKLAAAVLTCGVYLGQRQQTVSIVVLMECPERSRRAAVFHKYGPLVIEVAGLHARAAARLLDPHAVVVIVKGDGGRRFTSRRQHLVADAEMISRSRPSLLSGDLV